MYGPGNGPDSDFDGHMKGSLNLKTTKKNSGKKDNLINTKVIIVCLLIIFLIPTIAFLINFFKLI